MNKISIIILIVLVAVAGVWFSIKSNNSPAPIIESESVPEVTESETAMTKSDIIGKWQATDDTNVVVVFEADGNQRDFYGDKELSSGTWELSTVTSDDKTETAMFLKTISNGETYEYAIYEITSNSLVLNYTDRGNTLVYRRIDR